MLNQFMDDQIYLCGFNARVHSLGIVLWTCGCDCNETNVNIICKVQGITTRFYNFHIGTYIYLCHCCQRGRVSKEKKSVKKLPKSVKNLPKGRDVQMGQYDWSNWKRIKEE